MSPYQNNVFTLSDRHTVIDFMDAEPLLPSILVAEGRYISYLLKRKECGAAKPF